jgi:peptide subunit release factor 1 (eRF1)
MIKPEELRALAETRTTTAHVLSAYLNLSPARQLRRGYQVVFDDLVRRLEEQLGAGARMELREEAARVRAYLEAARRRGLGLVVFSCSPRGLWRAYHLPVPVADDVRFGPTPYLRPLLDVVDEHERYAVALVDKEKARFFTVFLGEIEEEHDLESYVLGHHDQGGWSQANYQRHQEAHVRWHLERVAERLAELLRRRPFDRLILAGPDEATAELRRILPRPLRARLAAVVPAELFAPPAKVLELTRAVEERIERAAERELVADLVETAASGGNATCGLAATLDAVGRGQVHKLVVAEGAETPGTECPRCGRLAAAPAGPCPTCGSTTEPLADVVERAVERVLDDKGAAVVVHDAAADRLVGAGGGLGALLRYRLAGGTGPAADATQPAEAARPAAQPVA